MAMAARSSIMARMVLRLMRFRIVEVPNRWAGPGIAR